MTLGRYKPAEAGRSYGVGMIPVSGGSGCRRGVEVKYGVLPRPHEGTPLLPHEADVNGDKKANFSIAIDDSNHAIVWSSTDGVDFML